MVCARNLPQHFNSCTCARPVAAPLTPRTESPWGLYDAPSLGQRAELRVRPPRLDDELHDAYYATFADLLEAHEGVHEVTWLSYPDRVEVVPYDGWNADAILADLRREAIEAVD